MKPKVLYNMLARDAVAHFLSQMATKQKITFRKSAALFIKSMRSSNLEEPARGGGGGARGWDGGIGICSATSLKK